MTEALFNTHKETLEKAAEMIRSRDYWSPFPEMPSPRVYGETAQADGEAAFKAHLNKAFDLDLPGADGQIGAEKSPFGFELGISYPKVAPDVAVAAAKAALPGWRDAGPDARAGVCLEILTRLNKMSFEVAFSVMHTTGQAFMMAFQAGGAHAQDRGLEAVTYAWQAQNETPAAARWTKPQGSTNPPLEVDKTFRVVPRGVAVMIGCSTFPTWNGYPGMFASLATGNPVVVKPHPGAVLPLAISVKVARQVLAENGYDPNVITLCVDSADAPVTKELCLNKDVKVIDFTGSTAFGDWLEQNCTQAQVYTEKAGVNFVVIESTNNFKGMVRNMAFALSLYSGQMCTTTQNIFVPKGGIETEDGHKSFDEVAEALAMGVSKFLGDPQRAAEVCGCIQSAATLERLEKAHDMAPVVMKSEAIDHYMFKGAKVHKPLILKAEAKDEALFANEHFGPISFVIACDSADHAIELASQTVAEHGAITAGLYSENEAYVNKALDLCAEACVSLAINFDGGVFVNQSAAFSDFHATGGNPAANAALSDTHFVSGRFRVVMTRRMAA